MSSKLFHVSQNIFRVLAICSQSKHQQLEIALYVRSIILLHENQTRVEKHYTQSDIKIPFLKTLGQPTEDAGRKFLFYTALPLLM